MESKEEIVEPRTLSTAEAQFLSAVQVSVGIELGQIELSAAQVIDLLPGQSFEFSFDPEQSFALRLGDEYLARARLVTIDDGVALEIVSEEESQETANLGEQVSS